MPLMRDGPASALFTPLRLTGNMTLAGLADAGVSHEMLENARFAPSGSCVGWGIPFETDNLVLVKNEPVALDLGGIRSRWLIVSHVADLSALNRNVREFRQRGPVETPVFKPVPVEHAADYVFVYDDDSEVRCAIERRRQIGPFASRWGENCFEAVSHFKPVLTRAGDGDKVRSAGWGFMQARAFRPDMVRYWLNWLWAWRNPHPDKSLRSLRIEPDRGPVIIFAITAGDVLEPPTRWRRRRKAVLELPVDDSFDRAMTHHDASGLFMEEIAGGYRHLKMDLGQVISIQPRAVYRDDTWSGNSPSGMPQNSAREVIVEYSAHADARFHFPNGETVSVRKLEENDLAGALRVVPPADRRVTCRTVDKKTGQPVAAKLHVHGRSGEYLPPMNHHRIPNRSYFADYSVDYVGPNNHLASYIDGFAELLLPEGDVFVEVTKGFEVTPVRRVFRVGHDTSEIVVELENRLDWRSRGWVTADTHVHFLSPQTALLEGAAEGVNVVNLLASQWGELLTNMGDFDGKSTWGSRDRDGDGEYLVRVGTENRQAPLGHISLLGYEGQMILPLCSDGPLEAAIGDPVNALVTEWAARCKAQGGTVVAPHFRDGDRVETAAAILAGHVDAVELTSLREQAAGSLNPYSLAYWYGFLNCGYFVAAVGGTDKMSAATAVGTGRTYARLADGEPFTYPAWQRAVERGRTFVTLGPLVDFTVDGRSAGERIEMSRSGGTVNVEWSAESVMHPMTRVELIVNGELRESSAIDARRDSGSWRIRLERSSWLAILLRGEGADGSEVIGAHTSPAIVAIDGSEFMAAADAVTILRHVEGSIAYLENIGPRADDDTYRRFQLTLRSAHSELHNRLHRAGIYHDHNIVADHVEHG
jgi:hypothetical protein